MKTFEINCIINDKENPSDIQENIVDISLITIIQAEDLNSAIEQLSVLYQLKEIISISEIL
jgi:hypothetical protein